MRDALGTAFLYERKWILLQEFYRKLGISTRNLKWLDLGCGKGQLLTLGKSSFAEVTGCDPSAGMLEGCDGLDVRAQDSPEHLPFPDASFNLETAVCVYHHLELSERLPVTREVVRTLKPGGIFGVIEHNPHNPLTRYVVSRIPVDANARMLTPSTTREILRAAGLEIVTTHYFLYLPERFYRKLSFLEDMLSRFPLGGQYAVFGRKPQTESLA
jgi:SAM-dependent methyltransferase